MTIDRADLKAIEDVIVSVVKLARAPGDPPVVADVPLGTCAWKGKNEVTGYRPTPYFDLAWVSHVPTSPDETAGLDTYDPATDAITRATRAHYRSTLQIVALSESDHTDIAESATQALEDIRRVFSSQTGRDLLRAGQVGFVAASQVQRIWDREDYGTLPAASLEIAVHLSQVTRDRHYDGAYIAALHDLTGMLAGDSSATIEQDIDGPDYAAGTVQDLVADLVVDRSTEASYYTSAPTTIDSAAGFIAWQPAQVNGVPRVQDRGLGNEILIEGARTNRIRYTQDPDQVLFWQNFGGDRFDDYPAPDGSRTGYRKKTASGSGGLGELSPPAYNTLTHVCVSCWGARGGSVDLETGFNFYRNSGRVWPADGVVRAAWRRIEVYATLNVDIRSVQPVIGLSVGGPGPGARDAVIWGLQVEDAPFLTSEIRNARDANGIGIETTRAADRARIPDSRVKAFMRSGRFRVTVRPRCTSAEMILANAEMTLFSYGLGTTNRIALVVSGGTVRLLVVQGGVTKADIGPIGWASRWQDLTLTFDAAQGHIYLSGLSAGNGVYVCPTWTMPAGDLYLGNIDTLTTPFFGAFVPNIYEEPAAAIPAMSQVAGATASWRADQGLTLGTGGVVSAADQSGNARDRTQGTSSLRPAYDGGIVFDGIDDLHATVSTWGSIIRAAEHTIFMVVEPLSWTTNQALAQAHLNHCMMGDQQAWIGMSMRTTPGAEFMFWISSAGYKGVTVPGTLNQKVVLCFRHGGGNIFGSVNGGAEVSTACGDVSATPLVLPVRVGSGYSSGPYANFREYETRVFNSSLSAANIALEVATLRARWGI